MTVSLRAAFPAVGALMFIIAALLLVIFPSSMAGIDFHQIHSDSLVYLCYGLQLGPLGPAGANELAAAVSVASDQGIYPCFTDDGSPTLLLQTYYPRVLLASLVAVASVFANEVVVLALPVVLMGVLGGLWGLIVGLPEGRATWLRWLALPLPLLGFAWVLWLGSLMTEGVFTLTLLAATLILWLRHSRRLADRPFVFWMLSLGILLLATRTSWPVAGLLWGFGMVGLVTHLGVQWSRARKSTLIQGLLKVLIVGVGLIAAWAASALLEDLLVPNAVFPPANEPIGVLPSSPADLLFVLRVSLDSIVVGLEQSLQLRDFGSIILLGSMPLLLVGIALHSPLTVKIFVMANWLMGLVIVGVVSLCCGGLNSYFRYLIPAMFITLAAAWLGTPHPNGRGRATHPEIDGDASTHMQDA